MQTGVLADCPSGTPTDVSLAMLDAVVQRFVGCLNQVGSLEHVDLRSRMDGEQVGDMTMAGFCFRELVCPFHDASVRAYFRTCQTFFGIDNLTGEVVIDG